MTPLSARSARAGGGSYRTPRSASARSLACGSRGPPPGVVPFVRSDSPQSSRLEIKQRSDIPARCLPGSWRGVNRSCAEPRQLRSKGLVVDHPGSGREKRSLAVLRRSVAGRNGPGSASMRSMRLSVDRSLSRAELRSPQHGPRAGRNVVGITPPGRMACCVPAGQAVRGPEPG